MVNPSFSWPTALSLALASEIAYGSQAEIEEVCRNQWHLQGCQFIERDETQCFIAWSEQAALIAFRGTESLGDWLGNLDLISTTRDYGKLHRGFLSAFQVVDSQLRAQLTDLPGRKLVITGHSLGGALATIAAAEWHGQFSTDWIYTFGQPAVGKGGFGAFMNQHYGAKFTRFVNDDDIVPRVPPTYAHVGELYHFDATGNLGNRIELVGAEGRQEEVPHETFKTEKPMLTETQFDIMRAQLLDGRARTPGVDSLESPSMEGLFPSFRDHSMERYIEKIRRKAGV